MTWRDSGADQNEALVARLDAALELVNETEEIWDHIGDPAGAAEARAYAARLRMGINLLNTRARELRREPEPPVMPMSITSRRASR